MPKKINTQLLFTIIVALADEAIVVVIILLVLWILGVGIPIWFIITLSSIFFIITFVIYRVLKKNPQLGFENMIGQSGLAVEPIGRKGTVKINRRLWFAKTKGGKIRTGVKIIVVEQTGLKLTVIEKTDENLQLTNTTNTFSGNIDLSQK